MAIKNLLGKKIKSLRTKKGLTQEKLAEMIGISQRSLSGIEIGENFMTAETLDKLIVSLDIRLDELFALEQMQPSEDLIKELVQDINTLQDEDKIKTIYKVVKAILRD